MIQKKICMLGSYCVGKTSLVRRYVESIFSDKYHSTIGVKIDKRQVSVDGREVTLLLWDVAGEEEKFKVPMSYVRGASGYLLVIDGTRPETLDNAFDLQERVEASIGAVPFVLVLNKVDLTEQWALEEDTLQGLEARGWPVIRSSALTGEGVEAAFDTLARLILTK